MTNKINGDFDTNSIEAFRSAYAARILSPEDQEVDERTGLPTDVVLNTSPWIQHTGLWKANDGADKNFIPNQILVPGVEEEMSDEEIDALIQEALEGLDSDEPEDLDELIPELLEEDEEIDELIREALEEQEVDVIIQELLDGEGFDESVYGNDDLKEEEIDEGEIEALLEEILDDIADDEEPAREEEGE